MNAEEESALVRLHRQKIKLWLLDDRDVFSDLRSILAGRYARFGEGDLRLNPLHPYLIRPGDEDARALGILLGQLTRHPPEAFEAALLRLQQVHACPADSLGKVLIMPMLTLSNLRAALEGGAQHDGWRDAASALRGLLASPLGPVLDGPTQLPPTPEGVPLQVAFARNNPATRAAVRGVIFRLADVMLRQHPGRLVVADVQRSAGEAGTPDVMPPPGVRLVTVSGH